MLIVAGRGLAGGPVNVKDFTIVTYPKEASEGYSRVAILRLTRTTAGNITYANCNSTSTVLLSVRHTEREVHGLNAGLTVQNRRFVCFDN